MSFSYEAQTDNTPETTSSTANNFSPEAMSKDPSITKIDEQEPLLQVKARPGTKCQLPCRYVLAVLTFWGLSVAYSLRVNLSVALVAMVNSTFDSKNNTECLHNTRNNTKHKVSFANVVWFNFSHKKHLFSIILPLCSFIELLATFLQSRRVNSTGTKKHKVWLFIWLLSIFVLIGSLLSCL